MDDKQDDAAVARQRSELLKDAAKRARQLGEVLEQAGALKETGFRGVPSRIARAAKIAEEDASAFSGKPHPGREIYFHDRPADRPVIHLFVDESGQAGDVREFAKDNDFFTLGAIAISAEAHKRYQASAERLKRQFFKDGTNVVLHATNLRQAMERPPGWKSEFTLNAGKSWPGLVRALERLAKETEFTAFGIIIQKWVFHQEFTETGKDPFLPRETYDLALHLLLERFVSFLASANDAPIGSITLESQNSEQDARKDAQHQLSIAETIVHGTRWVSPEPLQLDIRPGVEFLRKQPSHPLELSDMLANFLYRLAQRGFDNNQLPNLRQGDNLWNIFYEKLYGEGDLRQGKFGLKVFPAGDLDDWLNDFREKWRRRT